MAGNYAGAYFLTSKAGEQLSNTMSRKVQATKTATPEILENYISTTNQNSIVDKEENNAIKFNAMSNISLVKSSAINSYNEMVKRNQLNKKFGI